MQQLVVRPEEGSDVDEPEGVSIAGRPAEDWSWELVEVVAGASMGLAIGTAVAGPVGSVVGAVAGAVAGAVTGETWESTIGKPQPPQPG